MSRQRRTKYVIKQGKGARTVVDLKCLERKIADLIKVHGSQQAASLACGFEDSALCQMRRQGYCNRVSAQKIVDAHACLKVSAPTKPARSNNVVETPRPPKHTVIAYDPSHVVPPKGNIHTVLGSLNTLLKYNEQIDERTAAIEEIAIELFTVMKSQHVDTLHRINDIEQRLVSNFNDLVSLIGKSATKAVSEQFERFTQQLNIIAANVAKLNASLGV